MPKILPWDVLSNDFQDGLLLGNGASMAVHGGFGYANLFEEAVRLGNVMTSPPNSGLFKTRGTVAFRQARRGARRSNEEVEIFRGADRLRTAVG